MRRPSSPVRANSATGDAASCCYLRVRSRYRVLRLPSRGGGRSVDRDCAGRNATSVKDVEPRQSLRSVVAEHVWPNRGNPVSEGSTSSSIAGTTGVRDHSMHSRQVAEHLKSVSGGVEAPRPWLHTGGQGLRPKSEVVPVAEVRCPRSSDEAGQRPWSKGGHGECTDERRPRGPPQWGRCSRMPPSVGYVWP